MANSLGDTFYRIPDFMDTTCLLTSQPHRCEGFYFNHRPKYYYRLNTKERFAGPIRILIAKIPFCEWEKLLLRKPGKLLSLPRKDRGIAGMITKNENSPHPRTTSVPRAILRIQIPLVSCIQAIEPVCKLKSLMFFSLFQGNPRSAVG